MQKIKIDNKEYELENLSEAARTQLFHIQATEVEINRMNTLIAVMQTARTQYATALKAELEKAPAH
jgi:hypothetical protein